MEMAIGGSGSGDGVGSARASNVGACEVSGAVGAPQANTATKNEPMSISRTVRGIDVS
jgi:hypothetical protein